MSGTYSYVFGKLKEAMEILLSLKGHTPFPNTINQRLEKAMGCLIFINEQDFQSEYHRKKFRELRELTEREKQEDLDNYLFFPTLSWQKKHKAIGIILNLYSYMCRLIEDDEIATIYLENNEEEEKKITKRRKTTN